jgi:glycosyltransferase involved in cell wall biosynthesis
VLFTALAFSKAIVASAVGGFPEVAALDAAAMVEPGDVQGLAETLRELVADPALRDRLEAAATAAAHGPYSWSAIADAHMALYRRLTSR